MDIDYRAQDRAIERVEEDRLDRGPFVASLVHALVEEIPTRRGKPRRRSRGFVVGLTGRWGLGKSSVLNILEDELGRMSNVIVAKLNPWLFKGRDELLAAYFDALRKAMGNSRAENIRELMTGLKDYQAAIIAAGKVGMRVVEHAHAGGTPFLSKGIDWLLDKARIKKLRKRTIQGERDALEAKLAKSGNAVVVLIDELDRIEDDDVRAIAQLIKAVGDIKGVSYMVAYDPERVADALGRGAGEERRLTGERYLEKIIQHAIPLRPLFEEDIRAFLPAMLEASRVEFRDPADDEERRIFNEIVGSITTPREIKRLVRSFAVVEAAVRGEINHIDVLAYCWILTKSPALTEAIAGHFQDLVDDPGEAEALRRVVSNEKGETLTPVDMLGVVAEPHKDLLLRLFPRFLGRTTSAEGDRLSRRQNLIRILYLGNPPGMIRRDEIEAIWLLPDPLAIEERLRGYKQAGRLDAFLDRFDDLLPLLADTGDATFFPALSRALERDSDWTQGPDAGGELARDVSFTIVRLASRNENRLPRVLSIIGHLIVAGDLMIVPHLLRGDMFNFGLVQGQSQRSGYAIYNESEVRSLMATEIPRYRQAYIDGRGLRRLPSTEALFAIENAGSLDSVLRDTLTQQIETEEGFATAASILTPPGHMIYFDTLDKLFDAASVGNWLKARPQIEAADPWLAEALSRLQERLDVNAPP